MKLIVILFIILFNTGFASQITRRNKSGALGKILTFIVNWVLAIPFTILSLGVWTAETDSRKGR
jgi:ABC-type methionine transport system permease subunit